MVDAAGIPSPDPEIQVLRLGSCAAGQQSRLSTVGGEYEELSRPSGARVGYIELLAIGADSKCARSYKRRPGEDFCDGTACARHPKDPGAMWTTGCEVNGGPLRIRGCIQRRLKKS